jgi:DNA-directed RNA polymerase specialized sigma subunit
LFRRIIKNTTAEEAAQELGINHAEYQEVQRMIALSKKLKKKKRPEFQPNKKKPTPEILVDQEVEVNQEEEKKDSSLIEENLFIPCEKYSKKKMEALFKNDLLNYLYGRLYIRIIEHGPSSCEARKKKVTSPLSGATFART